MAVIAFPALPHVNDTPGRMMKGFTGARRANEYSGEGENTQRRKESSSLDVYKVCSHLPSFESLPQTLRQDVLDA